ncbi:MAG: hydroxymethylglutaryl-CoA lyase [Acidimicrobiales bacterium]|jgi:hydroxymethylglutaryl-CoA lyase
MPRSQLPSSVTVREVGPRDGLQSERPVEPARRAALVDQLAAAGCRWIEAVSFVSPRAVPAMAGAAEVLGAITARDRIRVAALVPNLQGAESALAAGVDEITVTIAASATYNERNVRRSIPDTLAEIERICRLSAPAGVPVDAVVSCAFGSPYEGDIEPREVSELCDRLSGAGVAALTLADTTGMATPRVLDGVLSHTGVGVGLHLHETRGTGLLNAYAALQTGVTRFDTSVGGLGGSPFADGAAGNLSTESLVALLDDLGISTGIDLEALIEVTALVEELVGHGVPSPIALSGPRTRRTTPTVS